MSKKSVLIELTSLSFSSFVSPLGNGLANASEAQVAMIVTRIRYSNGLSKLTSQLHETVSRSPKHAWLTSIRIF